MPQTITQQQSDTLKLIERSPCDADGWTKCSVTIFNMLILPMPDSLVEKMVGKARLTAEARIVLEAALRLDTSP